MEKLSLRTTEKQYIINVDLDDSETIYKIGMYYLKNKDYNKMKSYFLRAISLGHTVAMCELGNYYQFVEKDYKTMITYYLMGIEHHNIMSMLNLGYYYYHKEHNYAKMAKYYRMANVNENTVSSSNITNKEIIASIKIYNEIINNNQNNLNLPNYYTDYQNFLGNEKMYQKYYINWRSYY